METNFTQKNPPYFCKKCDFITNNKKDYSRHIMTLKHKRKQFQDFDEKKTLFVCKSCKIGH